MVAFHEAQRLRPRFRWLVAFPPALVSGLAVAQRWLGHPIGARGLSNDGFAALSIFLWAVYVWLSRVHLVTDVDDSTVSLRLTGLARQHRVLLSKVTSVAVVTVDAERDFGGYGFRTSRDGVRAYVARTSRGVRLGLDGGGSVVVGSARPDDLAAAISRHAKAFRSQA